MADNKNLPAYPIPVCVANDSQVFCTYDTNGGKDLIGFSKRELGAFMAPDNIPEWFQCKYPIERPDEPKSWQSIDDKDPSKQELQNWHRDPIYDLPEELKWYQESWEKYREAVAAWHLDKQSDRYFKWRIYYSETLLTYLENTQK